VRRGAVVLCGGRSTRMGRDKAALPFGGETLLQRVVRVLGAVVAEVVVVSRPGQALPDLPPDVRPAHDEAIDRGPLGGLLAGLRASSADAVWASACDVPFLHPAVVDLLFRRLGAHDAAVCEAQGRLHPLAAVYRPRIADAVAALLADEEARATALLDAVDTVRVGEPDLRAVDPTLDTLANLNTPADYEAALARLAAEGG
jgi:molybdenum cofactor guanylyltransferase